MNFEWDDAKYHINMVKHGISFDEAIAVFVDPAHVTIETTRPEDGEKREKAVGKIEGILFTIVFTIRPSGCRVISARRANRSEERAYGYR
jgi:uncharacterized DUF497 family protein